MRSSQPFAASGPCRASPDGRYVAALGASAVSVYATGSLRLVNVVKLPPELQGPVCAFLWAPSSTRLLVATAEHIHVFAAIGSPFCAAIRNPGCAAAAGKPPLIYFGASHDEVLVCCVFGLKLTAFRLSTSTAVEIANPKFHHAPSATRGFAVRPGTGHLAVLTRVGGKDMLSIHHPRTRSVERSWSPESVDAQGIMWTPDGKWLLLWESWAQGHRLMLHTPDGQHFRTIGPASLSHEQALGPDRGLELGFKACQTSPDARLCALGDCSRGVTVLCTKSWRESMRLLHPATIVPRDTMQVWQEQSSSTGQGRSTHSFVRTTQMVSPPASAPTEAKQTAPPSPGCSLVAFDSSSTLLATRLDESPCAIWIWDVPAAELRAVLIFHSSVGFVWHPSARELLLVTCQDDSRRGTSFVWDPLSNGPLLVSPAPGQLTARAAKTGSGRPPQVAWVDREAEFPELLVAGAERAVLLSLSDAEDGPSPWQDEGDVGWHGASTAQDDDGDTGSPVILSQDDILALDDTFSFRNTPACA